MRDTLTLEPEQVRKILRAVAAWMHGQDQRARAKRDELLEPVREVLERERVADMSADRFLRLVRDDGGLLTGYGVDVYGFMHLGFQEYLTARWLRGLGLDKPAELWGLAKRFEDSWWQEVILLMLAQRNPPVFEPFMRALAKRPELASWADTEMMDLCFTETAVKSATPFVEVLMKSEAGLGEQQVGAAKVLRRKMPEEFARLEGVLAEHPAAEVRAWWSSLQGSGTAGDAEVIVHEKAGIELVRIPAGSFLMGTAVGGLDRERPQHEVTLEAFYMARTPVTNAEYGRYLAANPDVVKPDVWGDRRYNQPEQPVVGVSWDEAKAYCDWAGLLLPTEAQW
ncbi:MAG: SUMF1/EgtB/PvdO family nonheme iron enzyme, partial [Myxococcales bacterium]|nr:SUMF1/EgtB/PvdO family nonheme iron enzyme [Myxococcales bacterium]